MNSLLNTMNSLRELFDAKMQEFADEVDNVHMVWLDEIQGEAIRMFSSDFSAEPELMPKTPSQKRSNRRKRVSVGRTDNRGKRRFSRGARSNLRSSTHLVQTLGLIAENVAVMGAGVAPDMEAEQPKRSTRRNKQQQASMETEVVDNAFIKESCQETGKEAPAESGVQHARDPKEPEAGSEVELSSSIPQPLPPAVSPPQLAITISAAERNSADLMLAQEESGDQLASKKAPSVAQESGSHAAASRRSSTRRVSVRCSLSGLRRSMTQQAVRRASRRSFLKKKAHLSSSSREVFLDTDGEAADQMDGVLIEEVVEPEVEVVVVEEQKAGGDVRRFTRSMAYTNTPLGSPAPPSKIESLCTSGSDDDGGTKHPAATSVLSTKRLGSSTDDLATPRKKPSPPNKIQSVKPNMKSFLHTVQKNQMLMSTPGSMGRNALMKSFIKHSTPLRVDLKPAVGLVERERSRLEALKKKQELELERKKKLEEEKKRKQEEMKRKRDERLRKVVEARVKEEQKEEEKKKKIEQKMAQMEEKNDKMRVERLAEEKAKKKVASKRQEELELRRKLQEEEAAKKKMQQEEEKRQQELQAKRRAEEEQERARKLAEARRAQELRRELEREREREEERLRQQQAAAERERMEREKADALRRELELAAREKERKEAEERSRKEAQERQKAEEEKAALQRQAAAAAKSKEELQVSLIKTPVGKGTVLNVTVEHSPQSYEITPKGGNKPVVICNPEDYGMDQNSDDSTDDESAPRKPIPSWAEGRQLQQTIMHQYFNPVDADSYFGEIEDPQLERIFYKSKPRYFKRTSSAVWHSPPRAGATAL